MAEAQVSLDVSDLKENFLECSVCLEHFDQAERRPRLLVNCLHSFCSQCLEQLLEKEGRDQITCPNCRQVQKVNGNAQSLPVDPVRNKLVDYVQFKKGKNIPCSDCPDGSHAVARCHECQSYMCTPCKEAHRRNRLSRKHTCQSLQEALSEPVKSFFIHRCQDHPDYKIEFYCKECSSPCCVSCPIIQHKGHDLDPIEDAANSMLSLLKKKIEEVEKPASVLRSMKTSLDEKKKMQEVNLKYTTASINKTFDELIGKLNCQRNILITELKDRTKSTVNGLKKQCQATEDSLAQIESTLEYFKQMESKSDDCEVLSAGPVLVKSLEAAAAVDLTEDVQDPTWTFSPGELDTVISKVHRFGEIHCDTKRHVSAEKGNFKKLSEGILMCQIDPNVTLDKNGSADLSPEKAIVVSEDHFVAVQHLIGKQEIEECFIVKDKPPSEKQIFFKNFMYDKEKKAETENFEQRIKGVIQEEVKFFETERKRAEEKVKTMAKNSDMFLIYKPDRNAIVIFTEDWQKMSDAKKKVQSKATSREGRRFASQAKPDDNEDKPATSTSSSKVDEEDTDCFRGKTITVRVYKADITKLDVDVIVNAANGHLSHGDGVAKAIADAAGPSLTREGNALVDKFGQIAVTDLAVTTAGNLPFKKVFHAVGPQWPIGSTTKQNQCQIDLCLTILRCLCQAEGLKMRSIAIPSISAAISRVPASLCAEAYVRASRIFDEISNAIHLKEVHLVDVSDIMVKEILSAFGSTWNKPVYVSQYNRERKFVKMCLENTRKNSPKVNPLGKKLRDFFSAQ